jgi:hypothetical protein
MTMMKIRECVTPLKTKNDVKKTRKKGKSTKKMNSEPSIIQQLVFEALILVG